MSDHEQDLTGVWQMLQSARYSGSTYGEEDAVIELRDKV